MTFYDAYRISAQAVPHGVAIVSWTKADRAQACIFITRDQWVSLKLGDVEPLDTSIAIKVMSNPTKLKKSITK